MRFSNNFFGSINIESNLQNKNASGGILILQKNEIFYKIKNKNQYLICFKPNCIFNYNISKRFRKFASYE